MSSPIQHYPGPCAEREFEIVELTAGTLPAERVPALRQHLQACARCRHWHDAMLALDGALAAVMLPRPVLSPAFASKLQQRIDALADTLPIARAGARAAAEDEYRSMTAALRRGWSWQVALNAVATASVLGGTVVAVQTLVPAFATEFGDAGSPTQLLQGVSIVAAVGFALVAARVRRSGFAALPSLFA
jgi:hypothetical protein